MKSVPLLLQFCCTFNLALISAQALPVITEFQAANSSTVSDEDGDFSDWIEIFNPDETGFDLSGCFLTDDPALPTKWRIPDGSFLQASSFLVVFASDKDRAVAGSQLHTNFKLSSAGEYLGLINSDGVSVLSEYVAYPPQFQDASFGLQQLGNTSEETLIEAGDVCAVIVPSNGDLGTSWTLNSFDDSSWIAGTTGVGYERSSGYDSYLNIDVESQMYNQQTSVYLRVPFQVSDAGQIASLEMQLQYDDGFVAYLNGVEVARDRANGTVTWLSAASSDHPDSESSQFTSFNLSAFAGQLVEGENVLAIHGLNRSTTSSDLLFRPRLIGTRLSNPSLGDPGYFLSPTPRGINGTEQGLPASDVVISVPSRTFTTSFQVSLSGAELGQEIRYTLDGSVPSSSSALYTTPITISQSSQLRARIIGAGNATGPVAMASYIFLSSDVASFSSNLPIVILDNWNGGKPNSDTDGFWAIIEPDVVGDQRSHMTGNLAVATRCNMRVRGSSSSGFAKYSLSLEAQNESKEDQSIRPLGMPAESDWVLSGRYSFDRALMRNPLIYQLSNESGEYAVRTRFVEVFLNTGGGNLTYAGDYFGVYTLMEKIKRDNDRVGVKRLSPESNSEPDLTGGYLWKKDRLDPGDGGFSVNSMGTFGWVYPKEEAVTSSQSSWLRGHLNEFDAALYNSNWTHPTNGRHFTEYIDNFSWLRHHWLNTLAMNVDGFRLSGYYYKHHDETNGGKIGAGPIWDFDRTMGSTDGRDDNPSAWDGSGDSSRTWSDSRYPWWGRALENPDFRQEHTDLWQQLRKTTFSVANIHGIIDEFASQLDSQDPAGVNSGLGSSPQQRNFNRWTGVRPSGGYSNQVNVLKNWLSTRVNWIDSQYTAQPSFSLAPGLIASGTNVTFTRAGGTVYYTTDGSDPRLSGGGVSAQALTSPSVRIDSTTILRARARSGTGLTAWSGEIQGTFLVGNLADASNLIVSEVHYAPAMPSLIESAVSADPSDYEWIELTNIGPTSIDLTDVHFEAGVTFSFTGSSITTLASGAKVLIVKNRAAFEARYGSAYNAMIAGEFATSRLDNAGERIHLVDALGVTIQDFTYNDQLPWPTESGFPGYSLVLMTTDNATPDHRDPANWRSSALIGGTPAGTDQLSFVGDGLEDQDQDGLQQLLEYALGTSDGDGGQGSAQIQIGLESILVDDLEESYVTITFQRAVAADDVSIRVETATDLSQWNSGEAYVVLVSKMNHGNGLATVKYRSAAPFETGEPLSRFFRLVAEFR